MSAAPLSVRRLASVSDAQLDALAQVLIDCVAGGASVSFMHPLSPERARAFWLGVADDVERGARALLVAEDDGQLVGTVQLVLDQPENQPHRADLSKMLVHRRARRRGVGEALLPQGGLCATTVYYRRLAPDTVHQRVLSGTNL